jgi:hypothetical protein
VEVSGRDRRAFWDREVAMRYGLLIYTNESDRPAWGTPEGDAEFQEYGALQGEMIEGGMFKSGDPFLRVAEAKSIEIRDGETRVLDGPAVDTALQLGGYYIVECGSIDEAVEIGSKIPGARYGRIEVRPVLEFS